MSASTHSLLSCKYYYVYWCFKENVNFITFITMSITITCNNLKNILINSRSLYQYAPDFFNSMHHENTNMAICINTYQHVGMSRYISQVHQSYCTKTPLNAKVSIDGIDTLLISSLYLLICNIFISKILILDFIQ